MRYFLRLAYDGSPFHGWQSQPNAITVQKTIEDALGIILRKQTPITGAGRTDTGVNARVMYAHFDVEKPIANQDKFLGSLNRLCGHAISIEDVLPVIDTAHARFDALKRSYRYFVIFEKSPLLKFTCSLPGFIDVDAMNEAARRLLEVYDFTSFTKLHGNAKTNICNVTEAIWLPFGNEFNIEGLEFRISADRFLRNMVRAIVGTLVDVGRGKISQKEFCEIIEKRDRCAAGTSMPPHPLFLWDIEYPDNIFIDKNPEYGE